MVVHKFKDSDGDVLEVTLYGDDEPMFRIIQYDHDSDDRPAVILDDTQVKQLRKLLKQDHREAANHA